MAEENKSADVTGFSVVTKDKKFMQIPFQPKDVFCSDFFFFFLFTFYRRCYKKHDKSHWVKYGFVLLNHFSPFRNKTFSHITKIHIVLLRA